MSGDPVRVGVVLREQDLTAWSGRLPELAERAVATGLDHLAVCGIDPRERGARTSETLHCVRLLSTGEHVDFEGRFFSLHGAIRPAPLPPIPILVGGRSDAALRRAAQLGDGWLALWISPRRFEEATRRIETSAAEANRTGVAWQHALQLWAGFGDSRSRARERLSATMQTAYSLPFERFERYVPCGPPAAIAEALAPYLAVGCRRFNFVPEAASLTAAIEAVAEVKALLTEGRLSPPSANP